jgi:hypothetical protein
MAKRKKYAVDERKYKIQEFLNSLPYEDYRIAKNKLPLALGVSKRTFERWMYLTHDDRLEVPADKLAIIAKFLGKKIEDFFNYKIPQYNTAKLRSLENEKLIAQLNLTR